MSDIFHWIMWGVTFLALVLSLTTSASLLKQNKRLRIRNQYLEAWKKNQEAGL